MPATEDFSSPVPPAATAANPTSKGVLTKALVGTVALAVGTGLCLQWLQPLVGPRRGLVFWRQIFEQDLSAAWVQAGLLLLLLLLWRPLRVERLAWPSQERVARWGDQHITAIAAVSFPVFAALAVFMARGHALSMDEYTVLMQSRVFATGHLAGTVPAGMIDWVVPDEYQGHFFNVSHQTGAWASTYWPGFALLLTPFAALGVPWLCNPLLSSLTVWALHRLARRLGGPDETKGQATALWATLLTLASPVIAINAGTYYSMPAHLLANTLFAYGLLLGTRRAALGAGLVGGWALLLHNPVPHAVFALPWLVWVLLRRRHLVLPVLVGYALLALPIGLAWSSYAASFDASRFATEYSASHGPSGGPFLDVIAKLRVVFAPPALDLLVARFAGILKVVAWASPGLLVLALLGWREHKRRTTPVRLLVASTLLTFAIYLFVPFLQGIGWGFRYMHSVWMVFPLLAGLLLAYAHPAAPVAGISVRRFFAACAILSALVLVPYRVVQTRQFISAARARVPEAPQSGASLTFIQTKVGDMRSALVQSDPFLRGAHWKLVHRGDVMNAALAKKLLVRPRLSRQGEWGQIWVGDEFRSAGEKR